MTCLPLHAAFTIPTLPSAARVRQVGPAADLLCGGDHAEVLRLPNHGLRVSAVLHRARLLVRAADGDRLPAAAGAGTGTR